MDNLIISRDLSKEIYLSHIRSLLNPYKNMKQNKNIYINRIYKPSKLSQCYSFKDIYNLKGVDSKKYFLIYYDENYEKI
jgi:hypothetical protein